MATQFDLTFLPTNIGGISMSDAVRGPLSSLYGPSKYNKEIIRYPRDLGSNPARKHAIIFTVKQIDQDQLAAITEKIIKGGSAIAEKLTEFGKSLTGDTLKDFSTRVSSGDFAGALNVLSSKEIEVVNAVLGNEDVKEGIKEFGASLIKPTRKDGPSIGLYIPDNVAVSYNPNYSPEVSLSDALGRFYFLAQGATSIAGAFKNQGEMTLTNMVNKMGNDPFVREAAFRTLGKFAGTDATRFGLNAAGYAMNPQIQVLFSGIGFRSFKFDFIFTPYNQEEAKTVKEIIYKFKYHSAPQIDSNGPFTQGYYMKVPDTFDIKFFYGNEENKNIHRIGECVLENVDVNYSGGGQWATFNDGSPNQIKMTLQFKETVIIDKTRIGQGY